MVIALVSLVIISRVARTDKTNPLALTVEFDNITAQNV